MVRYTLFKSKQDNMYWKKPGGFSQPLISPLMIFWNSLEERE